MIWPFSRKNAFRKRDISWALEKIASRRSLLRILNGCPPSSAIETAAVALNLDTEKVLGHVAAALNVAPLFTPLPPTADLIQRCGFSPEQLRRWKVAPQPSESAAHYALAIADPGFVSVQEFQTLGIPVFLSLGSRIEAAWNVFSNASNEDFLVDEQSSQSGLEISSTTLTAEGEKAQPAPPETSVEALQEKGYQQEEVVPILAELAVECLIHGARDVRMLNGTRCCYEFISDGNLYSGTLHPDFLDALRELGKPNEFQSFNSPIPGLKVLHLEVESEHAFRLSWEGTTEARKRSHRVVIIDDDERFAYLLSALLRNRAYEVQHCSSARDALPQLLKRTLAPDIIICDVHMPGMDGGGFLAALQQTGLIIPTLMLTSDEDPIIEAEMAILGAGAFLQKREDPRILIAWIENLLQRNEHDHSS